MSEELERREVSIDAAQPLDAVVVDDRRALTRRARIGARLEALDAGAQAIGALSIAATGFLAGATVVGLAHRRRQRSLVRPSRGLVRGRPARAGELMQIVASRSLLLDVHLLGSGRDR